MTDNINDFMSDDSNEKVFYIPFTISIEDAKNSFNKYWGFFSTIPFSVKKTDVFSNVKRLFIPTYVYDISVDGVIKVDAFNTVKEWNDNNFKYQEIEKYLVKYKYYFLYKNNLALGTDLISEKYFYMIMPFNLDNLKEDYVSNINLEMLNNNVDENKCIEDTKKNILKGIVRKISSYDKHDKKKIDTSNLILNDLARKKVLLPIWFFTMNFKNKNYSVIVNGQTGEIIGQLPKSKAKILVFASLIFLIVFTLLFLISYFL